jgi:hypothetical protein
MGDEPKELVPMDENEFFNRVYEYKYKKRLEEFESKCSNLDINKFNYVLNKTTSVRFELIKLMDNEDKQIEQMIQLMKDEGYTNILNLPEEFLEWIARHLLNIPFTLKDINKKKEKYKLKKDEFLKTLENENININKKMNVNDKTMKIIKEKVILDF